MAKTYSDTQKLEALGKINEGRDLKELVKELDVSYPKLLQWRRELKESVETGTITKLIDIDKAVIHEAAESVKQDLIELDPAQAILIEGELDDTIEGIDGYNLLSVKLQAVALSLANKIDAILESEEFDTPTHLESLVASLARIQEAFFNKNGTYIQVLNNNSNSSKEVSKFAGLKKS